MTSRTFRDCADCHKRVLMEDGRTTCEGCLANRVVGELCTVDTELMICGWATSNTPAGAIVEKLPRPTPVIPGDTHGMTREAFIARMAAEIRHLRWRVEKLTAREEPEDGWDEDDVRHPNAGAWVPPTVAPPVDMDILATLGIVRRPIPE